MCISGVLDIEVIISSYDRGEADLLKLLQKVLLSSITLYVDVACGKKKKIGRVQFNCTYSLPIPILGKCTALWGKPERQ